MTETLPETPSSSRPRRVLAMLKSWLPKGHFARSVAVLGGGTAAACAIAAIGSPIITRLYSPTDFGTLGVFASIISILGVMTTWRFEMAIPVAEDDQTAADVLVMTLCLVVGMSVILGGGMWLVGGWLSQQLSAPTLAPYLWLTPIGLATVGVYQVLLRWAVRKKAFPIIAKTKMWQGLGVVAAQIGLGLLHAGALGLLIGNIVWQSAGSTSLVRLTRRHDTGFRFEFSLARMARAANRFRRFPLYSAWATLLNAFSVSVVALLLSAGFGAAPVGFYTLAVQVLGAPMSIVGNSIGQVFFSSMRDAKTSGTTAAFTLAVYRRLLEISMPVVLVLACAAPELFAVAFGPEWRTAGKYAQWLLPYFLMEFLSSPLWSVLAVLEHQHIDLLVQLSLLIGRLAAMIIGTYIGAPMLAVVLCSLAGTAVDVGGLMCVLKISGNRRREAFSEFRRQTVAALPVIVPTVVGKFLLGGDFFTMVGAFISAIWIGFRIASRLRGGVASEQ